MLTEVTFISVVVFPIIFTNRIWNVFARWMMHSLMVEWYCCIEHEHKCLCCNATPKLLWSIHVDGNISHSLFKHMNSGMPEQFEASTPYVPRRLMLAHSIHIAQHAGHICVQLKFLRWHFWLYHRIDFRIAMQMFYFNTVSRSLKNNMHVYKHKHMCLLYLFFFNPKALSLGTC